jgi:glutathione S-transferase
MRTSGGFASANRLHQQLDWPRSPAPGTVPSVHLRVHRIPWSTNVERVALAAGHKGLEVEWVDHDPADRSAIRELSGQELVPVAEIDGEVVVDSTRIIDRLEELVPEPRLYPAHACQNAGAKVFVEWFNEVWKGPPNALVEASDPALSARLAGWRHVFEDSLAEPDYLLGPEFTVADVTAFPFLKYGLGSEPRDDDPFHRVLAEHMPLGDGFPNLRAWIERCDRHPRA